MGDYFLRTSTSFCIHKESVGLIQSEAGLMRMMVVSSRLWAEVGLVIKFYATTLITQFPR